ncbi:MAG: PilW family protein [Anaerovoracaceae bacterium]
MQRKKIEAYVIDNKGFTLIELIMAVAIMTLVMSALVIMVSVSLKQYGIVGSDVNMQQNSQFIMEHVGESIMESSSLPHEINVGSLHGYAMDILSNDGERAVRIIVLDENSHRAFTKLVKGKEFVDMQADKSSKKASEFHAAADVPLSALPADNEGMGDNKYTDLNKDFDISDDIDIVDENPNIDGGNGNKITDVPTIVEEIDATNTDEVNPEKDVSDKSLSSYVTGAMLGNIVQHPEQNLLADCVDKLVLEKAENGNLIPVKLSMNIGGRTLKLTGKYRIRNMIY